MLQGNFLARKEGKLRLGTYPYTYARVSVMRSSLLAKEDYHKLAKMEVNEVISFLQGSQYRKEIDELAVKFKGVELMELALNRNLANTWAKLRKISPEELRVLVSAYLLRIDIWNIKTLIRAKYTKLPQEQLQAMLMPSGGLVSEKLLAELAKKDSVEDVLKASGIADYGYFSWAVDRFKETKSLAEIENALDRHYYHMMAEFSRRIPSDGRLFREFIERELEISAIMNVLRLKRAGTAAKEVQNYVTIPETAAALIKKMIAAPSAADAARLLEQSRFKPVVEDGVKELVSNGSLVRLELDLNRQMLKRSALLMHQHPLSVDVILGYMFAKEIEVRNLKLLLKSKKLGMAREFAEQQLVMV